MLKSDARALHEIFEHLWHGYVQITPTAERARTLLQARGDRPIIDHVTIRTFAIEPVELDRIVDPFLTLGYAFVDEYELVEERVRSRAYVHHSGQFPALLVSELDIARFPRSFRALVEKVVSEAHPFSTGLELVERMRTWSAIPFELHQQLADQSPHAASVAAFGIRAHHVAVDASALQSFSDAHQLSAALRQAGIRMEWPHDGSRRPTGEKSLLEQCATRTDHVELEFADSDVRVVPGGQIRFIRRHVDPRSGELYRGFVPTFVREVPPSATTRWPAAAW